MLVYVHCWFLSWLKLDFPLLDGLLDVEAEDFALMVPCLVTLWNLQHFFTLSSLAEGITWFAGNLICFFSSSKSKILSAFLTLKS
jgi:hypothetical protein